VLIAALAREGERFAAESRVRGEDPDAFVVDHEEVCVVVDGTRHGRPARVRIDTLARGREDWALAGGTLLTATPPGIVAGWLADGSLHAPGVHPPETVIDPERLFAELDRRGMRTTVQVSEPGA
jgi:saccharopine dehydrogenase-like NADP-dependent oxidoreductase